MRLRSVILTACLAGAFAALPPATFAAHRSNSPVTLMDLADKAAVTANAADDLEIATRSPYTSPETAAYYLRDLRDDVNAMGRLLAALESQPAEQEAIGKAKPILKELADNVGAASKFFNANPAKAWLPQFDKFAHDIEVEAIQFSTAVDRYVQLARVQAKEKHLEKALTTEAGE